MIATIIYGVQRPQMPKDFIRFEALAFICFIGLSPNRFQVNREHMALPKGQRLGLYSV